MRALEMGEAGEVDRAGGGSRSSTVAYIPHVRIQAEPSLVEDNILPDTCRPIWPKAACMIVCPTLRSVY